MRVALYYPWIHLTSGAERLILELTARSRHDWTLFTNHYDPEHTFPGFRERRVVELPRVPVDRRLGAVVRAGWRILAQRLPTEYHDALLVVCEGLGDLAVFRNGRRPVLCCCLTPLRMAFDPAYQARVLERSGLAGRLALRAAAALFRRIDRRSWRRYRHVFFISREAERRAVAGGLRPSGGTEILHPGAGISAARPGEAFEPFFLVAGRIMWTKNVELGILAFQHFQALRPALGRFRLVIAGTVDDKSRPYLIRLRALAENDPRIEFRPSPTDAALAELYATCYGLLFTPFNEDWGMVPLEAMAFGKPVIAVNCGGPLESIQDGVQGFLAPAEPGVFAERMARLADDPAEAARMGRAGVERARAFSWEAFAARIDDMIETVAASPALGERGWRQDSAVGGPGRAPAAPR